MDTCYVINYSKPFLITFYQASTESCIVGRKLGSDILSENPRLSKLTLNVYYVQQTYRDIQLCVEYSLSTLTQCVLFSSVGVDPCFFGSLLKKVVGLHFWIFDAKKYINIFTISIMTVYLAHRVKYSCYSITMFYALGLPFC